jgi:hypothetical protein
LWILIAISFAIRAFIAWTLELGNDEVYYWTYALYPDLSHFDHPPMVGYMIQFFSLNLLFDSEIWIRMSSLILGSINIWLFFQMGKKLHGPRTGLIAATLYVASVYGTVITGIFILPDTPQMFFWLISLYLIIDIFHTETKPSKANKLLLYTGILIGLGMLSKYTSVYLWFGIFIYIILFDRKWLKSGYLYLSVILSIILFSPVIWWNIQNDFVSLSFQGGRVNPASGLELRPDYFFMEVLGEFLYNNPINVVLIILAVISLLKKRIKNGINRSFKILLSISLPLIFTFLFLSLFKRTLPHWTAPAYTTLLLLAAYHLNEIPGSAKVLFPKPMRYSLGLLLLVMTVGILQIKLGIIRFDHPDKVSVTKLGQKDISLDIYGWKKIGSEFTQILQRDRESGYFNSEYIISHRWFPAANLDYYAGFPNDIKVLGLGYISAIHKYYWINQKRGGFDLGMNAYCITTSHNYSDPYEDFSQFFSRIEPSDTLHIKRNGKHVMNVFIYRLKDMKQLPRW